MLELVICTHNRAEALAECLDAIAAQAVGRGDWAVTVIDNACTDATPEIVARAERAGRLPGLRRISEAQLGLTHARLAGIRAARHPWIALVDDDCRLQDGWIAGAIAAAAELPAGVGAFGGRVGVDWGRAAPGWLRRNGWLFASQAPGEQSRELTSLVGTGMILRRSAMAECGWLDRPLVDDRIGRGAVSGGDVEICVRLRHAGYRLVYRPELRLTHLVARERQSLRRVLVLARGLGAGSELVALIQAPAPEPWLADRRRVVKADRRHHVSAILRFEPAEWLIFNALLAGRADQLAWLAKCPEVAQRLAGRCASG